MAIIEVENVTKRFRAARGVRALLGRGGIPDLVRGRHEDEVTALEDITFAVEPGESLGVIGANGSGKSTLLKIVAGVTVPTEGSVRVNGRVASLLELGAGFHPLLSGRENVYLNAGIHGVRHAQVDAIFDRIVDFSGLGKFIDFPIATYSSGMYVRLGFAVAAHTNPDIFLIDEVLAVGDEEFQRRCRNRIGELIEQGKTLLFVSHDLSIVNVLCKRVVLLSRGKMILRESPTKAIDFYLRQVGAPEGLHTLRDGPLEASFCNGRISLFYNQDEVTAPTGLRVQVFHLNSWHKSMDAKWEVTAKSETRCTARGRVAKLGLTFVWDLHMEGGDFVWSAAYECDRPLQPQSIEAIAAFPTGYTQWTYDDESGAFHEIAPEDTVWLPVKSAELLCEHAGLLSENEDRTHAVMMTTAGRRPGLLGSWSNSEFLSRSRIFCIEEHPGESDEAYATGRTEAFTVRFTIGTSRNALLDQMKQQNARHTVESGALRGRFDRGQLRLSYNGVLLSSAPHLYASLLIRSMWNDSIQLRWDRITREGDALLVSGSSRRFPFRMHWTVSPGEPDSLKVEIELETLTDIEVQEYQTSLLLTDSYTHWESGAESGDFPGIAAEADDWVHVNHEYPPASVLRARGPNLPAVAFEACAPQSARMTVLNAGYRQRARVLQALCTSQHGAFHFAAGRHVYFTGSVGVERRGQEGPSVIGSGLERIAQAATQVEVREER